MHSIVDDDTTYRYTTREVKLTGLPRFDRLLEEGKRFPPDQRDLILIAPTWRQWLSESEPIFTGRHSVRGEDFRSSEYAKEWSAVVEQSGARRAGRADRTDGGHVAPPELPGGGSAGVASVMSGICPSRDRTSRRPSPAPGCSSPTTRRCSSTPRYLERPVVYFQFDRERVNAGWHLGRHGYFDYARDGYGPVTLTADEAIAAITKTVESGPDPEPVYLERIRESFPERDGRCCERVADAIIESMGPAPLPGRPSLRVALSGRVRGVGRRAVDVVRRPAS